MYTRIFHANERDIEIEQLGFLKTEKAMYKSSIIFIQTLPYMKELMISL